MILASIYDSKAKSWTNPSCFRTRGEAIRQFHTIANTTTSDIARYPADYTLFELGTWDPTSGHIEEHDQAENLGTAAAYIDAVPADDRQLSLVKETK